MLNFENIDDLVCHLFDNLDNEDHLVTVISDKAITIEIMKELLKYDDVILNSCDLDTDSEYNKEYAISLLDDINSDYWYINIKKCYSPEADKYLSYGGYVIFHEDANSKAVMDMENNELLPLDTYNWFIIGD